jgi:hypothetical protein
VNATAAIVFQSLRRNRIRTRRDCVPQSRS